MLVFRTLLLAYPAPFRREFGEAMLEHLTALRQRAATAGRWAMVGFWRFALADVLRSAIAERRSRWRRGSGRGSAPVFPKTPRNPKEAMSNTLQEIRLAVRRLAKTPAFSLTAIAIVALGIGANTAIFSFVDGVLLRPQPYADPEQIVDVYQDSDDGEPNSNSFPAYRDIKANTSIFSDAVAIMTFGVTLLDEDGARPLATEWVTSNYLSMLGLAPYIGRDFEPADQLDGGEPVALLSYDTWQNRFGADPDILGRRLNLGGTQVTVVGIAPRQYGGILPGFHAEIWLSLSGLRPIFGDYVANTVDNRGDHWFMVKGRLQPGVTTVEAQSAMTALADRLAQEFPDFNEGRRITVFGAGEVRLHPEFDSQLFPLSFGLMGIVGLVLLIACSNLANLLLLRSAVRARDISVRMALGASRVQIFAHVLSESILLALAGGAVGTVLARWAIRAFSAADLPLGLPAPVDLRTDPRMMVFTTVLALMTGIVFGIIPALRLSRSDVVSSLRDDVSPLSFRGGRFTLRNALVVGQVALSFVLLVVAGLFVRSLGNAQNADLGFDPQGLVAISADFAHSGYGRDEAATAFDTLRTGIEQLPGVEAAALAQQLPVRGSGGSSTLVIDGYVDEQGTSAVEVARSTVGPGYFRTVGIPLLHGRTFELGDNADSATVAVISSAMARAYWNDTDAVGGRFRGQGSSEDSWIEVIGVVDDVKIVNVTDPDRPVFYLSTSQSMGTQAFVIARTSGSAAGLLTPMRDQLRRVEPTVPVLALTTFDQHLARSLVMQRFTARMLSGFGMVGLVLAALGMYAVVGFAVQRRTSELGIRMALGAERGQMIRMVIGEVMSVIAVALLIGIGAALLVGPGLRSVLFGVAPADPMVLAGTAGLLAVTAMVATWLPARRAASVDPINALRSD